MNGWGMLVTVVLRGDNIPGVADRVGPRGDVPRCVTACRVKKSDPAVIMPDISHIVVRSRVVLLIWIRPCPAPALPLRSSL